MKRYYERGLFNYIFTTLRIEDRDEILQSILILLLLITYFLFLEMLDKEMNDIQMLASMYNTGLECKEHIIYTGMSMKSKLDLAYFTYLRNSENPVVIIGSNLKYGKSTSDYVRQKLLESEITNVVTYIMKEPTAAEGNTAVSVMRTTIYPSTYNII